MSKSVIFSVVLWGVLVFLPSEAMGRKKSDPFPSDVHVVLVGFDGWGSFSLEKAEMPVLRKMMSEGSWTLKKRSVLPSSSAANWASMFMGASPEIHGYTEWNSQKPEIPSAIVGKTCIFPTISQLLHFQKEQSEIGLFYQWNGIKYVADTLSVNYMKLLPKHGKDGKLDTATSIVGEYIIDKKPTFCTIIYDYPDHFGHANGFDSDEYYQSLKEIDRALGQIIQYVKNAGFYDKTIFIISSDHGGDGKIHGGKTLKEMETPFVILGRNIKKGFEVSEFMMQYDIAATIAYIFGLEIPQAWIGRPVKSVFEKVR